jgi:protein-tyrosine phosphatase
MIDIHNHSLPNLDDGSTNIKVTEHFLDLIVRAMMEAVVFTPRFMRGFYDNTKENILDVYNQVEALKQKKQYTFKTYCAAEVYLIGTEAVADIQNNSFMINGTICFPGLI